MFRIPLGPCRRYARDHGEGEASPPAVSQQSANGDEVVDVAPRLINRTTRIQGHDVHWTDRSAGAVAVRLDGQPDPQTTR